MIKPNKVLCKRSLIIGDDYYWDESIFPAKRVSCDNRMLVTGNWYDVVFNKNDNNYNLPRTYAKWFYTPKELEKRELRKKVELL